MVSVPTTDDLTGAASDGAVPAAAASLGGTVGRSVLGPGIGTSLGAVLGAAALDDGDAQMMAATIGLERGMTELFAGGMGGGSSGGNSRGRM